MSPCCRYLLAITLIAASAPNARALDMTHVTCRGFLSSGQANMAAIIMWLRGYHAGKSGVVDPIEVGDRDHYGSRLGRYCGAHPETPVIDASEHVLAGDTI
jgi:hypothetical protein